MCLPYTQRGLHHDYCTPCGGYFHPQSTTVSWVHTFLATPATEGFAPLTLAVLVPCSACLAVWWKASVGHNMLNFIFSVCFSLICS